ncbi:hypothetical protein DPMN_120288 [Dreissena polymorpha]|uniref:Uncharacterized protein n=1 Tax=Dreissena polymorpha TaxID=45954 RepID=A0A9D4GRA0_DREPO|nr:hypothetical protein DPMN_120288 [Dreissena polymorpha]
MKRILRKIKDHFVLLQISKNQFRGDSLTKHLNVAHHHKNIQDATTEGTDSGQAHLMQASDESHRRRRLMKYFLADGVFRKSILSNDFGIVKKTQDDLAPHHKNIDYTDADRRQPHVMTVSDASQMRRRLMQKFLNDAELRKSILSDNTSNVDKHIEYTTPNKQPAPAKHEVHNSAQTLPSKVTKKSLPIVEPTTLRPTMASTITTFATQENVSPNTTKVVILKAIEGKL